MTNTISEWATHFYIGQVNDHDKVYKTLLPILNDPSYFNEPWIYSNCQSSCQSDKNHEIPWDVFFDAIKPNVEEYLESLEPTVGYHLRCDEVWLNKYDKHGHQEIHDHAFPNRAFSCAYVLEYPENSGSLVFENTSFPIIQALGINRIFNKFNYEKFIPVLSPGTLIIFPSWVKHYVLPNNTDERRSTITANFIIEGDYS